MTRSATLVATLRTIPDAANVAPSTVVALPPSTADPIWDEMRVVVNGQLISRAFDPGMPIVTGAPIALTTESGAVLTTEAGDRLTTEVLT